MGSSLRLTLPGFVPEASADEAWRVVSAVFRHAERDLTRFDPGSALSQLNVAAGGTTVTPILGHALHAAWRAFRATHGRFDPRIIGALEAAGERAGIALSPSPPRLRPTGKWLWLDQRRSRARVAAPIDLGGIGKGLALRWATHSLERAGHRDFLLQAGGDIVARGTGPAGRAWLVSIDAPPGARQRHHPAPIELRDEAVATSSIAVRHWFALDGSLRHHLIDPATGRPALVTWWSVTVKARDPAWAEVASKVGFLAGHRIGESLGDRFSWWACDRDGGLAHVDRRPDRATGHQVPAEP